MADLLQLAVSAGPQQQSKPVYRGIYSDWTVEQEDVREVLAYRAGINVAAAGEACNAFVMLSSSTALSCCLSAA